jgi:hypothetical protein
MFVLKKKGTNKYVKEYNRASNHSFTTDINQAKTFINLDGFKQLHYVASEFNPEDRSWVTYYPIDFDIIEIEIKEKKTYNNLRRK